MYKCPKCNKTYKNKGLALACPCTPTEKIDEDKQEQKPAEKQTEKPIEKIITEKITEITKVEDDKIDDSDNTITETSPDVDNSPHQDSSIFIIILIIIALVAGIVIFFADEIKGIFGGSDE